MPRDPARLSTLLAELKRRKVFRVAAVYGGAAFVVIQVADIVFPRLSLPDWTVTLVVVLALVGLVPALALAWAFDATGEGVRRAEPAAAEEIQLGIDPTFDPLRTDQHFIGILDSLGLPNGVRP